MVYYVRRSDGAYASYEGMSQEVITVALAAMGLTGEFIDEATFTAAMTTRR